VTSGSEGYDTQPYISILQEKPPLRMEEESTYYPPMASIKVGPLLLRLGDMEELMGRRRPTKDSGIIKHWFLGGKFLRCFRACYHMPFRSAYSSKLKFESVRVRTDLPDSNPDFEEFDELR
jgi:hypothetical protein